MNEKYFSLESIKQDIEWLQSAGSRELLLREVLERFEYGAIPAADVRPVVRGQWAHLGGDEWCCTACGFVIHTEGSWEKPEKKFCEDCGADMRLEGEEQR